MNNNNNSDDIYFNELILENDDYLSSDIKLIFDDIYNTIVYNDTLNHETKSNNTLQKLSCSCNHNYNHNNSNYIIDDDIDFYSEILKDDEDDDKNINDSILNKEVCLLSGLPLTQNYIKLTCSHTFNYENLFKEIQSQKQYNEYNKEKLIYEIKCPYCRTIIKGLLPYIPTIIDKKITRINHPEKYCLSHKKCSYIFKRGKKKGEKCDINGFETDDGDLCEKHWKKLFEEKNKVKNNKKNKKEPGS